jgi:hypothetical protein
VAEAIGLEIAVAEEIVFAADHWEPRLPIRDNLIAACRAPERATSPAAPTSQWWWDQPMSVRARWAAAEQAQPALPFPEAGAEPFPKAAPEEGTSALQVEAGEAVAA